MDRPDVCELSSMLDEAREYIELIDDDSGHNHVLVEKIEKVLLEHGPRWTQEAIDRAKIEGEKLYNKLTQVKDSDAKKAERMKELGIGPEDLDQEPPVFGAGP